MRVFLLILKTFLRAKFKSDYKGDAKLKEILFSVSPDKINDKSTFLDAIESYYSSSAAKSLLLDLFSTDLHFEIYKLICERTLLNFSDFKEPRVQYDNRPIEKSSFGQR